MAADDDEYLPGFEPAPRPGKEGRYSVTTTKNPWTDAEELVLFTVLPYCGTRAVYRSTCLFLCRVLGRLPAYPSTARPTDEQRKTDAVALIERRVVTSVMRCESPETIKLALKLYQGHRDGLPVTWAEHVEFILPFVRKEQGACIDCGELLVLLGRSKEDWNFVAKVMRAVSGGDRPEPPHENSRMDPTRLPQLEDRIQRFLDAGDETSGVAFYKLTLHLQILTS